MGWNHLTVLKRQRPHRFGNGLSNSIPYYIVNQITYPCWSQITKAGGREHLIAEIINDEVDSSIANDLPVTHFHGNCRVDIYIQNVYFLKCWKIPNIIYIIHKLCLSMFQSKDVWTIMCGLKWRTVFCAQWSVIAVFILQLKWNKRQRLGERKNIKAGLHIHCFIPCIMIHSITIKWSSKIDQVSQSLFRHVGDNV